MSQLYMAQQALDGRTGHDAGRLLLRQLWDAHVGGEMPEISIADGGKPYFVDKKWHFSISHTKRHAFCVLSDAPVGIDAEEQDRNIDLRLAQKILSPQERLQWEAAEDKRLALLTFWVLKEAAAKLSGEGLHGYPNHTDFSLTDPRVQPMGTCLVAVIQ